MAKAAKAAEAGDEDLIGGETAGEVAAARPNKTVEVGSAAARKLKGYINRIERIDSERQSSVDEIKEIYKEIRAAGYETKVVRKLVGDRKKDAAQREEFEALLGLYRHALGMDPAPAATAEAEAEV